MNTPSRWDRRRTLTVAAAAMAIGSICPWASLLGLASATGLAVTFGWISLLAGLGILALHINPARLQSLSWIQTRRRLIMRTAAVLSAIACVLVILGASDTDYGAAMSASWGCYLTLIASITAFMTILKALVS